jgi:hypothetical protein
MNHYTEASHIEGTMVKEGRRQTDWKLFVQELAIRGGRSALALLDMFKDRRGKWSMTRILWAVWTLAGLRMIWAEIAGASLSNAAWQAWTIAEAMFSAAVMGPTIVDFWKSPVGTAIAGIGAALRSAPKVRDVLRDQPEHAQPGAPVSPKRVTPEKSPLERAKTIINKVRDLGHPDITLTDIGEPEQDPNTGMPGRL